ncbi:DNA-directed RNA polymerase III subunit RPC6 [Tritrichomonas musculus]|uniref:DNA-directed RNA polymerase III subunit RPC6 n=1 Tax=Tritrichomonas musculus TaxID=1915356 RepID=A0ABR2HWD8_9EUKA
MSSRQVQAKRDEIRQKELSARILKIFQDDPNHNFSPKELEKALGNENVIDQELILKFIKNFIDNGNVRNVQLENGRNRYRYVPEDLSEKFCKLSQEHHRLYSLIEEAGTQGIWRGELKKRANIDEKQIASLLKQLKERLLIKEIASVTDKKKTYFLYDIDPPNEVTGGIWFSGSTFNSEMVDQAIEEVISRVSTSGISVRDLRKKVKTEGISNIAFNDEEADQLINAAISTGRIYKKNEKLRPGPSKPVVSPISKTACKGCPFIDVCEPGGAYDPPSCPYLQKMTEYY